MKVAILSDSPAPDPRPRIYIFGNKNAIREIENSREFLFMREYSNYIIKCVNSAREVYIESRLYNEGEVNKLAFSINAVKPINSSSSSQKKKTFTASATRARPTFLYLYESSCKNLEMKKRHDTVSRFIINFSDTTSPSERIQAFQ